jgi:hypothetical protein
MKGLAMGKLAQKVSELNAPQFGLPCGVSKVMSIMDEDDKNTLELILFPQSDKVKRFSNRQIQELLLSEKYDIAQSSIALHRRKQCRCFTGINARIEALGNK